MIAKYFTIILILAFLIYAVAKDKNENENNSLYV